MAPPLVVLAQATGSVSETSAQEEVVVELQGCEDASSRICDVVLDLTGSATAADIADFLVGTPLRIALVLGIAFLVTYLLRRASRRISGWMIGAAEKKQAVAGHAR